MVLQADSDKVRPSNRLSQTHLGNTTIRRLILQRIAALQPGQQRKWGRMTAHQMLCHLNDSFRVALGEKYASPATTLVFRTVGKFVALYVPIPWPRSVATRPEVDQTAGGTPPSEFDHDRRVLLELIDRFGGSAGRTWGPHPLFGAMTEWQWQRWGYLHTDHHLRQFGV